MLVVETALCFVLVFFAFFFFAWPRGERRAIAVLVTSDTARPLSVDQMEEKCK